MTQQARAADEDLVMYLQTRSQRVLYVWHYFYLRKVPAPGDEKAWRVIELATTRIRMTQIDLHESRPPDIRLRAARSWRAAARRALRQIELLSHPPESWVIDALRDIEAFADELMRTLSEPAAKILLH